MKKPITNIQDIYALAGGSTKLAAELNLHAITVEGWRRSGIPVKHWPSLIEKYDISPAELYYIYKLCRKAVTAPTPCY